MPTWSNWAGQQRCAPVALERPGSEEEVAAAVGDAAGRGLRVRAVGSGQSFTDVACTDGVMLDLSAMNMLLDSDRESGLVRVQPGITLNALGRQLAERGLALENQGDIDAQTLAGALATATHGTGARFGNLSSRVEAMRVVSGAGELTSLTPQSDGGGLRAARVGVGAAGIVTEVTLRCVPLFTLRRVDEPRPLAETLERLDEHVDGHDHFEFWAFPHSDVALCRFSERLDGEPRGGRNWGAWAQENLLENAGLGLVFRLGRTAPRVIPCLNRLVCRAASGSVKEDRSWRVYATKRAVRFTEMEYAIPRAHAREAAERVLELVTSRRLPVGFPIEVRFSASDDAFLSTAHGRETAYVAVHQFVGMEYESYFRAVERIMGDYEGRPHWGKRSYHTAATLAQRYPAWARFRVARARLDPPGTFANEYTDRLLGQVGSPVAV